MDDLTAALATSFSVSNRPNSVDAEHPRFAQYKAKGQETSQTKRRRNILGRQKDWYAEGMTAAAQIRGLAKSCHGSRFDFMNHVRRLAENIWEDMSEDESEWGGGYGGGHSPSGRGGRGGGRGRGGRGSPRGRGGAGGKRSPHKGGDEAMEVERALYRPGRYYRDQLMLSEWMVEVPEDFETEWVMVPCPVGKRNLVVASNGYTTSYSKGGYKINEFRSNLPGGNKHTERWNRNVTLLDTIYNEVTKTYYVLDMMCWKEMPLYESETEFRFFWMHDRLGEYSDQITHISKLNPYRFEPLPNFSCQKENITKVMDAKMHIKLDGLLFYHKHAHYLFGSTPLVVWLKAYMLPDILNIPVPEALMKEKPPSYTTFEAHTEKVKRDKEKEEEKERLRKEKRRSKGRRSQGESMEVLQAVPEGAAGGSGSVAAGKETEGAGAKEKEGAAAQAMEGQGAEGQGNGGQAWSKWGDKGQPGEKKAEGQNGQGEMDAQQSSGS